MWFLRYGIKMFRNNRDPTRSVTSRTMYNHKKRHMTKTGTLGTCVNHDDRKFGATLARLMGVPLPDIRAMGLWSLDVMNEHYVKIHAPNTAARMGGFPDAVHYFLPRAFISPFEINDDGIVALGRAIFPELDNPNWIGSIAEVSSKKWSASHFLVCLSR